MIQIRVGCRSVIQGNQANDSLYLMSAYYLILTAIIPLSIRDKLYSGFAQTPWDLLSQILKACFLYAPLYLVMLLDWLAFPKVTTFPCLLRAAGGQCIHVQADFFRGRCQAEPC